MIRIPEYRTEEQCLVGSDSDTTLTRCIKYFRKPPDGHNFVRRTILYYEYSAVLRSTTQIGQYASTPTAAPHDDKASTYLPWVCPFCTVCTRCYSSRTSVQYNDDLNNHTVQYILYVEQLPPVLRYSVFCLIKHDGRYKLPRLHCYTMTHCQATRCCPVCPR